MKNQHFQPRTLPKPIATFPELPGSARELSAAAEMLFGRLSNAPAPARAESGRPQNWSPAISGSPNSLKIGAKSILSAQNPSKTSCNLPRAPWKRHRTFWSRSKALWRTSSGPAPARAKSGRPQNWSLAISSIEISMKIQYFLPRTVPKPSAIFLDLSGNATELPGAPQVLSGRLSGAQAPARAESGRPQNWSPVFFCVDLQ